MAVKLGNTSACAALAGPALPAKAEDRAGAGRFGGSSGHAAQPNLGKQEQAVANLRVAKVPMTQPPTPSRRL